MDNDKGQLRFLTCGSVDDGKSTLIGRLLFESGAVSSDLMADLRVDSRRVGTRGSELDFALLVDGLSAEREQGITIDVAYRYFSSATRQFIVADTPGHEQYTRNMVTGASTADLAVVLIDARKGVLTQTRRHSYLLSLLGVPQVIVAVNKMDLIGYDRGRFLAIEEEYRSFAPRIDLVNVSAIPIVAVDGDNIVEHGPNMPWYDGKTLLEHLDQAPPASRADGQPFRLPVQCVLRPSQDFRGFAGLISSGTVRPGDRICVAPSGRESRVARILVGDRALNCASAGQSVTVTLVDDVDVSRGDIIACASAPPPVADTFQCTIVWLDQEPMAPRRTYLAKLSTQLVTAAITSLTSRLDVDALEQVEANALSLNEIGSCTVQFDRPVVFQRYRENRDLGGFILIDRLSAATVGAGLLESPLAVHRTGRQPLAIDNRARAHLKGHLSCVVWFTGISGAGKSTIANLVETRLHALGCHTYLLDGDNVRQGLNRDLGFEDADRVENIRRVAEVARLMADAGLIVLVACISPFRAQRRMARDLMSAGEFFEVHVDTPLEVAEARDRKGLYAKARQGLLPNFTGVSSRYEPPEEPELRIETVQSSAEAAAETIVRALRRAGILRRP